MTPSDAPERPCVGSGHCCKTRPCAFGRAAPDSNACLYLELVEDDLDAEHYRCGRYELIRAAPGAELSPAFGAGCSSPLFNTARDTILIALHRKGTAR